LIVATLDQLRREIDGIDVALHDLLIRRVEIGREVAQAKAGASGPNLRPGREAQVMRQLATRNRHPLSPKSIARVWREILSANLNQQVSITAAVFAPELAIHELAYEYCGTASSLISLSDAAAVVDAVASGSAQIGILPGIESGKIWRWWPRLLETTSGSEPRIIARLPFFISPGKAVDALIIARQEPESSGDDRTLFAIPRGDVASNGRVIDSWENDKTWHLVEVNGFAEHPEHLGDGNWLRLGAYAIPIAP
jgi:chorismate mutase/prephenate dehydratase